MRQLQRQYRRLRARRRVDLLRQTKRALADAARSAAATKVQSQARKRRAQRDAAVRRAARDVMDAAALFLQELWRRKVSAWSFIDQALAEVRQTKKLIKKKKRRGKPWPHTRVKSSTALWLACI